MNHPAPTQIYTLSLHDALPICPGEQAIATRLRPELVAQAFDDRIPLRVVSAAPPRDARGVHVAGALSGYRLDRKSTRLNSSHQIISYAVFCLKKKIISYTQSDA